MSQPAKEQAKPKAEPQKPKAKKHRMRGDLYDLSGAVAKLKNRKCPRCGSVMASHGGNAQRWVCGSRRFADSGQQESRTLRSRTSFYPAPTANPPDPFISLHPAAHDAPRA